MRGTIVERKPRWSLLLLPLLLLLPSHRTSPFLLFMLRWMVVLGVSEPAAAAAIAVTKPVSDFVFLPHHFSGPRGGRRRGAAPPPFRGSLKKAGSAGAPYGIPGGYHFNETSFVDDGRTLILANLESFFTEAELQLRGNNFASFSLIHKQLFYGEETL